MGEGTETRRHFPVFLDLRDRLAVVIGTGSLAEKRARQLQRAGADIVVVTPKPTDVLLAAQADGALTVESRPYVRGDLEGAFLAMCVEDDEEVQQAVFAESEARGCLCNVAGVPRLCNFILPSVLRRGDVEVAISTGGIAPEAAKTLRQRLAEEVGEEWAAWVTLIADARQLAAEQNGVAAANLVAAATDAATLDRLAAGEHVTAEMLLKEL